MEALPLCLLLISINAFSATMGGPLSAGLRQFPPVPKPSTSCQCGQANQKARIYNGVLVKSGEIPWQAGMQMKVGTEWDVICGAAVISNYYVATAAHCFSATTCSAYRVVAGITDLTVSPRQYMVIRIVLHLPSQVKYANDIALMKLSSPFTWSSALSPICLPPVGTTETFASKNLTISGWGQINKGGPDTNNLLKATVKGMSNDNCKTFRDPASITPDMLCAYGKSDACTGDSGGPAGYKARDDIWFLAGIVSWGPSCGTTNKPGVYVRVTYFIDWIHNKTENSICTRPFNLHQTLQPLMSGSSM